MKPSAPPHPRTSAAKAPPAGTGLDLCGRIEAEPVEPRVGEAVQVPAWLVALFGVMLFWATMYLDRNGGGFNALVFNQGELLADVEARVPRSETDALLARGRNVFNLYCSACHQPNGRGDASRGFPPLAGSDWVLTEGPNRMIRIVLNGLQGPITVNGAEYNNVMLPWRDALTDEDIAAVVTFVRGNAEWANNAGPATPAQVKAIRDATAGRSGSWTAPELLAIPVKD
jgi:mono/diheme cytochrome c family protein